MLSRFDPKRHYNLNLKLLGLLYLYIEQKSFILNICTLVFLIVLASNIRN